MGRPVHRPLTAALSACRSPAPQPATKRRRRCSPPLCAECERHRGRAHRSRDARFHVHGSGPKTCPFRSTSKHPQVECKTPQVAETTARGRQVPHMAPPRGQVGLGPRRAAHKGPGRVPGTPAAAICCAVCPNSGTKQVAEESARGVVVPRIRGIARAPRTLGTQALGIARRRGATAPRSGSPLRRSAERRNKKVPEMAPPRGHAYFGTRRAARKGPVRVPGTPATARVRRSAQTAQRRDAHLRAWGPTEDELPVPQANTRRLNKKNAGRRRVSEGARGARDGPAARPSGLGPTPSRAQGARSDAKDAHGGSPLRRSAEQRDAGRRSVSERPCGAPDCPAFAPSGLMCREECKTRGKMACHRASQRQEVRRLPKRRNKDHMPSEAS